MTTIDDGDRRAAIPLHDLLGLGDDHLVAVADFSMMKVELRRPLQP